MDSILKGKRILVADDEMDLRMAIVSDLVRRGAEVFEATNGNEAFDIAVKHKIEIVISDVRMPNGTGIELLRRLREIHISIPFVLLATGFADLTEAEAYREGAQALVEKPINRKKLFKMLEDAVLIIERNSTGRTG